MNAKQKREPKEPLIIPLDFEQTIADMLKVPPPDAKPQVVAKTKKSPTKKPRK